VPQQLLAPTVRDPRPIAGDLNFGEEGSSYWVRKFVVLSTPYMLVYDSHSDDTVRDVICLTGASVNYPEALNKTAVVRAPLPRWVAAGTSPAIALTGGGLCLLPWPLVRAQRTYTFVLTARRGRFLLQAQDERAVFAWIYKIDSLYYGFLESKRGIAAHQSMMTTAGGAAGGRARSSTMR